MATGATTKQDAEIDVRDRTCIDGKGMERDAVKAACRSLWAAHPHGSPYIAYLWIYFPYGRPPSSPRASAPLSTLPLWLAASIVAMAELAGLVEPRAVGTVLPLLHEAFRTLRGGEG